MREAPPAVMEARRVLCACRGYGGAEEGFKESLRREERRRRRRRFSDENQTKGATGGDGRVQVCSCFESPTCIQRLAHGGRDDVNGGADAGERTSTEVEISATEEGGGDGCVRRVR